MPIYEYRCSSCGVRKEHLQKISDPKLTACPECGKETYEKQVTAAGFQLKGSGWYVTDFRNGSAAPAAKDASTSKDAASKEASGDGAKDSSPAPAAKDTSAKDGGAKDSGSKDSSSGSSAAPAAAPAPSTPSSTGS